MTSYETDERCMPDEPIHNAMKKKKDKYAVPGEWELFSVNDLT